MSTLNLQVGASADDATEFAIGGALGIVVLTYAGAYFGDYFGRGHAGLRFTGVSGLQNATINSGILEFRAASTESGSFIGDWYAEDSAAPATFVDTNYDVSGRARTSATVEGNGSDFGGWTSGEDHTFPVTSLIQYLANNHDPTTIVLVHIYTSGTGQRRARAYDWSSALAPKLDIDYTAATGDIILTPDPVATALVAPTVALSFGTKTVAPDPVAVALIAPPMVIKPAEKVLTPAPVELRLVVPSVTVTVAIAITPDPVAISLVVPSVSLDMGTKTLTPDPVVMPLVVPIVTVTGITGAIVFGTYKWTRIQNPSWYPVGSVFYLVVILRTVDAGTLARARFYNVTDGVVVTDSELTTTSEELTEVTSPSSFSLASGDKQYRVEVGGLQGGEFHCEDARLKAVSG